MARSRPVLRGPRGRHRRELVQGAFGSGAARDAAVGVDAGLCSGSPHGEDLAGRCPPTPPVGLLNNPRKCQRCAVPPRRARRRCQHDPQPAVRPAAWLILAIAVRNRSRSCGASGDRSWLTSAVTSAWKAAADRRPASVSATRSARRSPGTGARSASPARSALFSALPRMLAVRRSGPDDTPTRAAGSTKPGGRELRKAVRQCQLR
jgi:hypothetical protein